MNIDFSINDEKTKQEMLVELRKETGLSRKAFADHFDIPYRTITDWERGERTMPDYVLRLIAYYIQSEGLKNDSE